MYIQLNSQIIRYEKTGEGIPVILLHGNGGDLHTFDALSATMSANHTVYTMDSRGHGESATPKEYHYEDMASDVINLIKALDIDRPYLIGYSDGGIVALLVALREQKLIRGLVACGANLSPDGIKGKTHREIKKDYKTSGNPLAYLMLSEPNIEPASLHQIRVPAMIFAGADDCIKEKESRKIADNIPGARLTILPHEDHGSYIEGTDRLYSYIRDFLI